MNDDRPWEPRHTLQDVLDAAALADDLGAIERLAWFNMRSRACAAVEAAIECRNDD